MMFNVGITIIDLVHPHTPQPPSTLCILDLDVSSSLGLLGVAHDDKLIFEKHICNIAFSITQKLVLLPNVRRLLAIMMQYLNPSTHLFYLALTTVVLFGVLHLIRI